MIRPSSSTCNSTLNTSGCAFSISSNNYYAVRFSTDSFGQLTAFFVSNISGALRSDEIQNISPCTHSYRFVPYCSSSNSAAARLFASSVLPTPVGPKNRKEPMGLVGSLIPALERMIASVTGRLHPVLIHVCAVLRPDGRGFVTLSLSVSLATGMPVQRKCSPAISSLQLPFMYQETDRILFTCFPQCQLLLQCRQFAVLFAAFGHSLLLPSGSLIHGVLSLPHFWKVSPRMPSRYPTVPFSVEWIALTLRQFFLQIPPDVPYSISVILFFRAVLLDLQLCHLTPSSSSSVGILSISVLIRAHASSTRSIALSGRNLSVIYRLGSMAALSPGRYP